MRVNSTEKPNKGTLENDAWFYPWYVVFICMVAYILSYVDRQILALLIDPIRADLGLTDTQFSLIMGFAFSLFYATMGIPIAVLADRKSRPLIISAGIFVWSLATAGCGFARSFLHLFLMRMGVGIGEASLSPAAYSMIADLFPKEKLGRALSIYAMGSFIGGGLALTIGGIVITAIASMPESGIPFFKFLPEFRPWQLTFVVVGTPGILVALVFLLTVKEPRRRNAKYTNDSGKAAADIIKPKEVLEYIKRNRKAVASHFIGFSFAALALFGIMSWSPAFYMRKFGLSAEMAGLYLGVIMLVFNTLGTFASGWLADFFQKRKYSDASMRAGMWGGIGLFVPVILFPIVNDLYFSLAFMALASFFASFPIATSATALQIMAPKRMRAQFSALFLFTSNIIGLGFGTTLIALITDNVFMDESAVGYSIAIVCTAAALMQTIVLGRGLRYFRESLSQTSPSGFS